MPDPAVLCLAGLAVLVGAVVQGGVGFGVALVAAPVLMMLAPDLMPGAMLVVTAGLPVLTLVHEGVHADWSGLGWAFGGRLGGTLAGVWVVTVLPVRWLSVAVGGVVLVATALSVVNLVVPRTRPALVVAGALAGVTGTATSIGGPPMALLYQRSPGPHLRATLAVFFLGGALLSIAALAAAGQMRLVDALAGLVLVPFLLAGFALSGPLRRYLDTGLSRRAVLALAAVSAIVLLVRALA